MKKLLQVFGYHDIFLSSLELRRQRAFVLTATLSALVILVDSMQNFQNGFLLHAREEWVMGPLVLGNYLLQRIKLVNLLLASHIMALLIVFQMLFSFVIPGVGAEIMLFWIATLPLILVLLVDLKIATKANIAVVAYLAGVTTFSELGWFDALFGFDVLAQVTVGYALFTTLVYLIEKSRHEYEEKLTDRMREREILLQEVHHRVKNNMQLMMSLLGLQAEKIEEEKYAKLFTDSINRLSAMSLVHESIYKAEDFEQINMQPYLKDIVDHLQHITRHKIEYAFEPLTLDMKSAMNLGLILNEAVSNALKYAYPDTEEGTITLSLSNREDMLMMEIKDTGVGLSMLEMDGESLGMTLMKDLSSSLPEGRLSIQYEEGLTITVSCKECVHVS